MGRWSRIGAGAVVIKDTSPKTVAVDVPAKVIREKTDDKKRNKRSVNDLEEADC
ncbi:hypothetical protein [Archaeoglobus sp. JdFR-39]|jgi:serine acetyltransferase|uniref:hypothetical protein n=1 Tax=Archaeoglobus sp. JdFR-39 TaxID=1934996 RepID=UPI0025BA596B|nr:hypothetical protein [Archaeoglobus sp. JdFR-39]